MIRRFLPLMLIPAAAFGYIRAVVPQTTTPLTRVDNTGIQFYLNNAVVAGAQSSASGSNVTVITGGSNPQQALHAALATWNAATGANIQFLSLKPTSAGAALDFQMTITIGADAADVSAVGGALAITAIYSAQKPENIIGGSQFLCTTAPCQYPAGGILDTDIILNPAKTFTTIGEASAYDLQATLTHELGHSLGLNHTGILGATMFQFNTLVERQLSTDDVAFIDYVYPSTSAPVPFGAINGTVSGITGTALLTLVDSTGASTFGGLTNSDGTYSVNVPAGTYRIYAEPLNGIVQPVNLYFTPLVTAAVFKATLMTGTVTVSSNNTATANFAATAGASAFGLPYIGFNSVGGSVFGVSYTQGGPALIPSGQSVDLLLAGNGFNGSLTSSNFTVLGQNVSVHSGGVRLDTSGSSPFGSTPVLRVTLDIAAQQTLSLASIFVTNGSSTWSMSGALVIGPPTPTTTSASIVNAGSYAASVSPGGMYALFDIPGDPNLGPPAFIGNSGYDPYGFLAPYLAGVSVTFDGVPAPIFGAFNGGQINLQVPFEVAGKTSTQMVVSYLGSASIAIAVPVVAAQPAFFTADSSGQGEVSARNFPDYSINTPQNPIARGGIIEIYGTGVGQVSYTAVTGQGAPAFPSGFTGNYTYSIGGSPPANALFGGWTPGYVSFAQWDLTVPANIACSAPPCAVNVTVTDPNGHSSQSGTTVYIK